MDVFSVTVAHAAGVDTFIANVNREIINPLILFLFALVTSQKKRGLKKASSSW